MANGHALLGASGSKMWLNCPGSARLNEMIPESTSTYAEEGRFAHELSELLLAYKTGELSKQKYNATLKKMKTNEWYNEEMQVHSEDYADYVIALPGEALLIEQKLDYSEWVPEGYGTGDAVKVSDDVLHVVDLKYGKGVLVEAEDNTQLKFYALGAIGALQMLYDFDKVVVHIFQPRLGAPTTAEYTVEEILKWADSIRLPAAKAWDGVQEYHSGPWCQFCRSKATCQTRMNEQAVSAFEEVLMEPTEVGGLLPNQLSDAEISHWLAWSKKIKKFLSDIEDFALEQAEQHGKTWEGFKLVEGRSRRVYSDEPGIISALDKAGVPSGYVVTKLVGVTDLEKLIGKKKFKEVVDPFIVKAPGKPTLVPTADRRDELNSEAAAMEVFKDE